MTDKLVYPRPANRDFEIHTLLRDLQEDAPLFDQYMRDPDVVLARYDLDDEARALLHDRDYQGLVARGVHPILIVQLQRRVEWGVSRYMSQEGRAGR